MKLSTILIVDDEKRLLKSLSFILKDDFNVLTASNGIEGLFALESNPEISFILLDLNMPDMDGVEMLQKLRERGRDVKVLVMTGKSTHDWAIRCADLIVNGYIQKPVEPQKLIVKIKRLLGIKECRVLKELWQAEYETRFVSLSPLIRGVVSYVKNNMNSDFTRENIASYLKVSPDHLSRKMHKETGVRLKDYINRCRIRKSQDYMIKDRRLKVMDVAASVGIENVNYFCKLFKKHTGFTPLQFQRKNLSS